MRSPITSVAPLLAILVVAPPASAATFTPAVTPPTSDVSPAAMASPAAMPSPAPSLPSSPTVTPAPSPSRTAPRLTPRPSPTPAMPADVDPTPAAMPAAQDDPTFVRAKPSPFAIPTALPVAPVRAFRTPEREAEPAFVAPQAELPADGNATPSGEPAAEPMPPPDQPYVATITFQAQASTDIDGFELVVIYPRNAGTFQGSRNGADCRLSIPATMFADDREDGMLRVLVAGNHPLTFPFDVVCRFTVAPNASLPARLIAVNVAEVTLGGQPVEQSALTISVNAH